MVDKLCFTFLLLDIYMKIIYIKHMVGRKTRRWTQNVSVTVVLSIFQFNWLQTEYF